MEWFDNNGFMAEYRDIFTVTDFIKGDPSLAFRAKTVLEGVSEYPLCVGGNEVSTRSHTKWMKECSNPHCVCVTLKKRNNSLKKYGVVHPSKSSEYKLKCKETKLKRYGDENFNNRKKSQETCLTRYGVSMYSKTDGFKDGQKLKCGNNDLIFNDEKLFGELYARKSVSEISSQYNVSKSFINKRRQKFGIDVIPISTSSVENEVMDFLVSLNETVVLHDRKILQGQEIDLYLPKRKIGIEINGMYWHSTEKKDVGYHINKTNMCERLGIHLIHIFDHIWFTDRAFIESVIINSLDRIYISDDRMYTPNFLGRGVTQPFIITDGENEAWNCGNIL